MLYEFYQDYFLSKDSRFDALDTTKVKALTKAGIIADMKANPLNKQYNGSDFPAKAWDAMIPIMPSLKVGKLPKPTPKLFTAKFPTAWGLKPTALRKAELGGLLEIERFEVASVMLGIWTISGTAAPSNKSPIADRRAYILSKLATDPGHQPSAPYPMYKRYGFANLADFVNHFDWGNVSGDTWTAKTWRFIKTVPITDPTTGELVCNHYGTTPPRRALLETNGGLFAAVAAAP
jgi:hypothetical protein